MEKAKKLFPALQKDTVGRNHAAAWKAKETGRANNPVRLLPKLRCADGRTLLGCHDNPARFLGKPYSAGNGILYHDATKIFSFFL